jgi:hypothetical protein
MADGAAAGAHQNGFYSSGGDGYIIHHNSIGCTGGCTADIGFLTQPSVNNGQMTNNLLLAAPSAAYCVYPGPGSPSVQANNFVWEHNIFQRGANGKCATYGPVYGWYPGVGTGNVWLDNIWADDGTAVPPNP